MLKLLIILPWLSSLFQPLNAKVDPPNYHFKLETLNDFFPGRTKADIEKKFGKPEIVDPKGDVEILKFQVKSERYLFPVLVQMKSGVSQDFFARLPSYFLHDVFFQSLVNQLGKQTTYKKTGEEAYYIWEKKNLRHVYSASCTITCFPVFYTVYDINGPASQLDKMKKASTQKP